MWLPLPAVAAPGDTAAESGLPGVAAGVASTRRLHVLVAEDHPVNRAYMEAVLDKLGHTAVFANDGASAVQAVQASAEGFDVVLMDLHMPGMDGFGATRLIRAMPAPRGAVPIVALTADAFHESRHLALESGMSGFLTKPAHLPQLREALARYGNPSAAPGPDAAGTEPSSGLDDPFQDGGLDQATIDDVMQSLTTERFSGLLTRFFDDQGLTLAKLRQCLASDDRGELRTLAHALKGASASLGLRGVAALAAQLQRSPEGMPADALAARLDALERQLAASHAQCAQRGLLTR